MGWPFCPKCRFTLDVFSDGRVECSNCPFSSNLLSMFDDGNLPISITTSADTVVPTWAKVCVHTVKHGERVKILMNLHV